MGKYLSYSGILALLLIIASIVLNLLSLDFNNQTLLTLGGLVLAFVFTPLFFIHHKQTLDAYKVPCYIASAIVGAILMLGSVLAGNTMAFGESSFYTGGFLALAYMVALLLFKPAAMQKVWVVLLSLLMIGGIFVQHFSAGTL